MLMLWESQWELPAATLRSSSLVGTAVKFEMNLLTVVTTEAGYTHAAASRGFCSASECDG